MNYSNTDIRYYFTCGSFIELDIVYFLAGPVNVKVYYLTRLGIQNRLHFILCLYRMAHVWKQHSHNKNADTIFILLLNSIFHIISFLSYSRRGDKKLFSGQTAWNDFLFCYEVKSHIWIIADGWWATGDG